ncbi:hypothetical protein AB733_13230 [Photobacterium swingsii]|uniref:DUF6701 domain-containing protein n=1 Tax=Photobacterium swingsii TaxID=680026 RepID=A0A0J8V9N4_9GAMM|nr:DUF6701 domain-containing protein [Photobacterium swingsii]KMV30133.1 hypothetical protein AB733_13230 [Photobacterium swingsii]PSW22671.1 hypothetical protein C9I94_19690 [Photobacterium swingsii]
MKKIKYLFGLLLIALSFSLQAAEPQFEFGELNVSGCFNQDCEITFKKTYAKKPLVFVMSTIERNGRDAPSNLFVTHVTTTSATIRQHLAPFRSKDNKGNTILQVKDIGHSCNNRSFCLEKKANKKINYFVIEEGEVNFGGKGRIKAGKVSVNKYLMGGVKLPWADVDYYTKEVSFSDEFTNPGILVSIQGNGENYSQRNNWITPVVPYVDIGWRGNYFYLGLDRSEVDYNWPDHYDGPAKDVAYIIAEGAGVYKGLQFTMGAGATPNTLDNDLNGFQKVTVPVIRQCDKFIEIPGSSGFTEQPMILASKSSRKGHNGGWLRYCQAKKTGNDYSVSFVNDEDLNERKQNTLERKHASENIGFMAFQRKVSEEVCDIFTGPAQTWSYGAEAEVKEHSKIYNAMSGYQLGFPRNGDMKFNYDSCVNRACEPTPSLMIPSPSLESFRYGNKEVKLSTGSKTISPDRYKEIKVEGSSNLTLNAGEYWVQEFKLEGSSKLIVNGQVTVHILKEFKVSGSGFINNEQGSKPDNLIILGHNSDSEVKMDAGSASQDNRQGIVAKALILAGDEVLLKNTVLYGAVTTRELKMESFAKIIGDSDCFDSGPTYRLEISPDKKDKVLACDGEEITFSVIDETTNKVAQNFTGTLAISAPSTTPNNADVCWFDSASAPIGTCPSSVTHTFTNATGSVKYKLSSKDLASINIQAKLTSHGDVTKTAGAYTFVPFALAIENKDFVDNVAFGQIAGREFSWDIVAKAKSGNSRRCDVMEGYTGDRKLTVSHNRLPNTAGVKLKIKANKSGSTLRDASGDFDFTFVKGKATGNKGIYSEAGTVTLNIKDKQYQGQPSEMSATESLYFRPFALALCDWNDKNHSLFKGDASSGVGLAKSGDRIHFYAKPLAWMGSGYASNNAFKTPIVNKNEDYYCGQTALTQFVDDTVQTDLNVGVYSLDTPSDGLLGDNVFGVDAKFKAGSEYGKGIVGWGDVGSFKVGLGSDDYLKKGFAVPPASFRIGRIYPAYFELTSSAVKNAHPANSLTGFTYMNQGWGYDFTLTAKANGYTEPTTNYSKFADPLKAKVNVALVDGDAALKANNDWRSRVTPMMPAGLINWNKATISKSVSDAKFTRLIDPKKSSATVTDDRVFPNMKVVVYSKSGDHTDPIVYSSSPQNLVTDSETFVGSALAGRLDARYGRMALDDVGTAFDKTVTVPMRVEYWDGQKFIVNADDSYTPFDGGKYCKQMIWPVDSAHSKSVLQGSGTHVTTGKTLDIQANPKRTDYYREQVRFWHKLVTTTPNKKPGEQAIACPPRLGYTNLSWLTYNWRDQGDESPSTVVTFGVYRGNDRIIYRGEKGMTALPN